jgi:mono/diheme cytochrome c family protein
MRLFVGGVLATLITEVVLVTLMWAVILPRLDWRASKTPGAIERHLVNRVLARWVSLNAGSRTNPVSPTPANLMMALHEYEEHCTACHGADGSGRDQFEADFYPPVPDFIQATPKLSDAELYFIIANGIRGTAMPAFGKNHSPGGIWRTVLWVRHLARLTPQERSAIERVIERQSERHRNPRERQAKG